MVESKKMNGIYNSKFIESMKSKLNGNAIETVNDLIRRKLSHHSPIIEDIPENTTHQLVTFLFEIEAEEDVIYLHSIVTQNALPTLMHRLGNSHFYYYTVIVAKNIRTSYSFAINMTQPKQPFNHNNEEEINALMDEFGQKNRFDPYNPKKITWHNPETGLDFHSSILEMPNAIAKTWCQKNPLNVKGAVIKQSLASSRVASPRNYWVYTPANYDPDKTYPMLMYFDGQMHYEQQGTALTVILDNLIAAKKIPPLIAVLVDSVSLKIRMKELMCDASFASFITDELIPKIKTDYAISKNPADCIVGGASLGGLFALYIALQHSEQFGMALCNSPAFWASKVNCDDILEKLIMRNNTPKLRIYMDLGELETIKEGELEMFDSTQHIHTLLGQYNHKVKYHTFAGGHDIICHEQTIPEALIWLMA